MAKLLTWGYTAQNEEGNHNERHSKLTIFFYYCYLKWHQHYPRRHWRQNQYISAVFFHVCVRTYCWIHLWMEADTGGYVSQPTSCCISSNLVKCKYVGIYKQRSQKNLTTLMHRKEGENWRNLVWFLSWEVGPTLTLTSAPPVAFFWVPKHTLVNCVPSACISCPHAMLQGVICIRASFWHSSFLMASAGKALTFPS